MSVTGTNIKRVLSHDLLVDDFGDLIIKDGDFAVGISNVEHAKAITVSDKGDWKEKPEIGVGIQDFSGAPLTDTITEDLKVDMKKQLDDDGFDTSDLTVESDLTSLDINTLAKRRKV